MSTRPVRRPGHCLVIPLQLKSRMTILPLDGCLISLDHDSICGRCASHSFFAGIFAIRVMTYPLYTPGHWLPRMGPFVALAVLANTCATRMLSRKPTASTASSNFLW